MLNRHLCTEAISYTLAKILFLQEVTSLSLHLCYSIVVPLKRRWVESWVANGCIECAQQNLHPLATSKLTNLTTGTSKFIKCIICSFLTRFLGGVSVSRTPSAHFGAQGPSSGSGRAPRSPARLRELAQLWRAGSLGPSGIPAGCGGALLKGLVTVKHATGFRDLSHFFIFDRTRVLHYLSFCPQLLLCRW